MGSSSQHPQDLKLSSRPCVVLERINLAKHLNVLSESCLSDLREDIVDSVRKCDTGEINPTNTNDDEIEVIEVKPRVKSSPVKIKRSTLQLQDTSRQRDIFRHALKTMESEKPKIGSDNFNQSLSGAIELVQDKLSHLKRKEAKLMEMVRSKRKSRNDEDVNQELEAMKSMGQPQPVQRRFPVPIIEIEDTEPVFPSSVTVFSKSAGSSPDRSETVFNQPLFSKPVFNRPESIFQQSSRSNSPLQFQREKKPPKKSQLFLDNCPEPKTIEEKYRALDARDKIIQARRESLRSHKKRKLVGTCPDMCPEKERYRRNYQLQVSPFEMVDYPRNTEVKEEWMVKDFSRSSADQDTPLPHDLRPVPVLQRTMVHLCRNIADRSEDTEEMLDEWFMFMWYRTRAIRKDLTHQDTCSKHAVTLFEQCARFHISCAERLVSQDLSVYDEKINTENLTKCLQTLKYMYNDLRAINIQCENAAEFLAYSLLLNLNNTATVTEIQNMPPEVINSKPIMFALDIITAREGKNYIRFFKLVKKTTYLNACILRRYFHEIRAQAIISMVRSHCRPRLTSVPIPLYPLADNLMFDSLNECADFLMMCNLRVEFREDGPFLLLDKNRFTLDELSPSLQPCSYIREKKKVPVSQIIWGGPLPQDTPAPQLQNSFDRNGELINDIPEDEPEEEMSPVVEEYQMPAEAEDYYDDAIADEGDMCDDYNENDDDEEMMTANEEMAPEVVAPEPTIFSAPAQQAEEFPAFQFTQQPPKMEISESTTILAPSLEQDKKSEEEMSQESEDESGSETEESEVLETRRNEEIAAKRAAEERERMERLLAARLHQEEEEERQLEKQKREAEALKAKRAREKQIELALNETRKRKLGELKAKYRTWKLSQFVHRWRGRACMSSDVRKMKSYLQSLTRSYPPICTPEVLDGNPFGVIIPNALQVHRKPSGLRMRHMPRFRGASDGPPPVLPLVNIGEVVGLSLSCRVRELYPDKSSPFSTYFPWKLVISLPDGEESNVRLDTFLEMHFVDRFDWEFGVEKGPLCFLQHKVDDLLLDICVRRVRGRDCYEGDTKAPEALDGANSLLFFLTDDAKTLPIALKRLEAITNRPDLYNLPVVIFVFGKRLTESSVRSKLHLDETSRVIMCGGESEQSLVTTLSQGLSLAASVTSEVPTSRTATLSSLLAKDLLDRVWRVCELSVRNFEVTVSTPELFISYYNRCLDSLYAMFFPKRSLKCPAPEFRKSIGKLESLDLRRLPIQDVYYKRRLVEIFEHLKLPPWPPGVVASVEVLTSKIEAYSKEITKGEENLRDLGWCVYQVMKDPVLWKGIDIENEENIEATLEIFPWVGVMREFARARLQEYLQSDIDIAVAYESGEIEDFCYNTPLLQPAVCFTGKEIGGIQPAPENDSILIAYAKAIERQMELEEAANNPEPTLSAQVLQVQQSSKNFLEDRFHPTSDSQLQRDFGSLNAEISNLEKRLEEQRKMLEELSEDLASSSVSLLL